MPESLSEAYQSRLNELGFLSSRGNVRMADFLPWFRQGYQSLVTFDEFSFLDSLHTESGGFAAAIVRKQPRLAHPFKHLLMINRLFDNWPAFLERYDDVQEKTPDWKKPAPKINRDSHPLYDTFIATLKEEWCSIRAAARQLGISVTTGTQWAQRAGIAFTHRSKTANIERIAKATRLLKKGLDKKSVVKATGLSETTVTDYWGQTTHYIQNGNSNDLKKPKSATATLSFLAGIQPRSTH